MRLTKDVSALGFLLLALVCGGAGARYPVISAALQLGAVLVLAWFLARRAELSRTAILSLGGLGLLIALPMLQLVPMPPEYWSRLPGRTIAAEVTAAIGIPGAWRPLTLDPHATLGTVLALLPAAAMFVAILLLPTRSRMRMIWLWLGFALISVALGALQLLADDGGELTPYPSAHIGNAVGFFTNRNHQATMLLMAIPFAGAIGAIQARKSRAPGQVLSLAAAAIVLLALGVVGTTSRMGLMLLPIAIGCGSLLLLQSRLEWKLTVAMLGGVGAGLLILLSTSFGQRTMARFAEWDDGRFAYWKDVLWAIRENGLWGTGFGTFVPVFQASESLELVSPHYVNHAHNDYLELLLEAGVPGMLALGEFLIFVVFASYHGLASKRSHEGRLLTIAGLCAIVIVLLHSVVDYPLRTFAISSLFGLACGLLLPSPRRRSEPDPDGWPRRSRAASVVRAVAVTIVGAAFGMVVIAQGWATYQAKAGNETAALEVAPWFGRASSARALERLERGDLPGARRDAVAALELSPIDEPAILTLGLIAEAAGSHDRAYELIAIAGRLGWRNPLTQVWLAGEAVNAGEIDTAMTRVDAVLRQNRGHPEAFAMLRAQGVRPDVARAFAAKLAEKPPWRRDFFQDAGQMAPSESAGFESIVARLDRTSSPASAAELNPYLKRLTADGEAGRAYALWLKKGGTAPIDDPGFERFNATGNPGPFSWRAYRNRGSALSAGDPPASLSGKALRVATTGTAAGIVLSQMLMLDAGEYVFSFHSLGENPAAIGWEILCPAPRRAFRLQSNQQASRKPGWNRWEGTFVIPSECRQQQLRLRASPLPGHANIIWVDSVEIVLKGGTVRRKNL
jgi:O-antigen ligase